MHLAFDIFQGLGIAAAVGIRPFLASLAVGGLAAGNVEIDFNHTHFSFLESLPFLLAMAVVGLLLLVAEVRFKVNADARTARNAPLALAALALGALLFAGSLARGHYLWWPGLIGGVICAAIGIVATHPLFARVRARLDTEAASAVPLYAEAVAIVFAALSVLAPPVGVIVLLALGWLIVASRRRADQKYAGLRILRLTNGAKKLVLVVIDALKPAMLERAIASGRAPALARIKEDGVYVDDCVAAFPSVTPVCAASITTGTGPDRHLIPSMNWYHREEGRYVEYGSSFSASRQFGVLRSLTDTVYRMNAEHLSRDVETVYETLDDADVRTAGTTYLIYRGRYHHEVSNETALARIVTSTLFRRTIDGPRELFYADLYASRKTGCRGQLGMPGIRDQHTGCVGAYLVENDLFDFMLFSLPDNDAWSHKNGPHAQVTSIAAADRQIERLMHAAGGPDAFLEDHAVIVTSDHSQAKVEERIRLDRAFVDFEVATRSASRSASAEVALSPAQRAAMVYALDEDNREEIVARAAEAAGELDGIDLMLWLSPDREEAIVRSSRGELRFAPGGDLEDLRGRSWSVEGRLATIGARTRDGRITAPEYPDALGRIWSALTCATAGDLLLSAAAGYEFVDWGGSDHVGGGSHGSLHRSDSLGALLWCGTGPDARDACEQWSLQDIAPMIREHFGVPLAGEALGRSGLGPR